MDLVLLLLIALCITPASSETGRAVSSSDPIDRKALVHRHLPALSSADPLSPFTVGNGEFAYTVDVTGLQTFADAYDKGIPLETESQWGWHTSPNPDNYELTQTLKEYDTYGRNVSYPSGQDSKAGQWLRANPHRFHLGRIGFALLKSDGSRIELSDLGDISQTEDIWEGIIKSAFTVEHRRVTVETACHPSLDQIGVRIKSSLLHEGNVAVAFDFPYASLSWGKSSTDWASPEKHSSEIVSLGDHAVVIKRTLDSEIYYVSVQWYGNARFVQVARHSFILSISAEDQFGFVCNFSEKEKTGELPNPDKTLAASRLHWQSFWETGGAVDLSGSKDPRAFELERRIVISRYLTAIQCAGSIPPQETGLTCKSWYGKSHLEMHWWHAVHFALWGHPELLEKSLSWYERILPEAEQTARRQGYEGSRWPKMVGNDGRESPSSVGVFLIWQQPHPIYYAELLYRYRRDRATLERYKDIVFASAEFMASYAHWDSRTKRYVLGPPLIPAQEIYRPEATMNPPFELSYWAFGIKTAQSWRERLGLAPLKKWDDVLRGLSKVPVRDGLYQNVETDRSTFADSSQRVDHPEVLGAFGILPNDSIDVGAMERTLDRVMGSWNWDRTWGWDYPLIAMTAARVGRPDLAINALLMDVPRNRYLNNGHNYQEDRLPVYLPGNGGLLTAVAMMAAGWDGAPKVQAPGFPNDGNWNVRVEGLRPMP